MCDKMNIEQDCDIVPSERKIIKEEAKPAIDNQLFPEPEHELQWRIKIVQESPESDHNHKLIEDRKSPNMLKNYNETVIPDLEEPVFSEKVAIASENDEDNAVRIQPIEFFKNSIQKFSMLPPLWLYRENLNGLEFLRMDLTTKQIKNHLRINDDLFITLILPNNEELSLNEKINSYAETHDYLKSIEKLPLCVGTNIEDNLFSPDCRGVIVGDDTYKRNPRFSRCMSCRMLRNRLRYHSTTNLLVKPHCTLNHVEKTTVMQRRCSKRIKKSKNMNEMKAQPISENVELDIKPEIKIEIEAESNMSEGDNFWPEEDNNDTLIKEELDIDWKQTETTKTPKRQAKKPTRIKQINEKKVHVQKPKENELKHCGICEKKIAGMDVLVKHLEKHKLDSCGICAEQFLDFTHLLAHRIAHVPDDQKRCHLCSKRFRIPPSLEFHYMKKHNFRGEGEPLRCKICLKCCETPLRLVRHVKRVHVDSKYICPECGKGFRQDRQLRSHLLVHTDVSNVQCDKCDFRCKRKNSLKQHMLWKHTVGKAKCEKCLRLFKSPSDLDKHICKHHLGVICPICGANITNSAVLTRHLRRHEHGRRFSCDRCSATFTGKDALRVHLNRHDDNREYRCEYCPKGFYSYNVLTKHRRIHTGEKPYVCKICGKGFTGNSNLKVHMKVHGQYLVVKRNAEPVDSHITNDKIKII